MNNTVTSKLVSIDNIININNQYNIPRYQRLYVWENSQVETMFEDLYEAYRTERSFYYLGGILIVKRKNSQHVYDLIDGQQRFTTLWLLSVELRGSLIDFAKYGSQLRLLLSIRENVKQYFDSAMKGESSFEAEDAKASSSLSKIINARNLIQGQIQKKFQGDSVKIEEFASYIRNKVQIILTEISKEADLNKLFEVINNRGLQLQQHEILKARLLNSIKRSRTKYGKIWSACADMDNYIERSLRREVGENISSAYSNNYSFHLPEIFRLMDDINDEESKRAAIDIISILEKKTKSPDKNNREDYANDETKYLHPESEDAFELEPVRSILTFPQLLLHTLRIFLYKRGEKDIVKIHEKELLKTFEKHLLSIDENDSTEFVKLLLDVRLCFDVFIIKWVKIGENDEAPLIKKLYLNNQHKKQTWYFRREKADSNDGFALLQSMLYHSQQKTTQYWLTPLLLKAVELRNKDQLYIYLRQLDNHLFCTSKTSKLDENLPQRTCKIMGKELDKSSLLYNISVLDEMSGIEHYWFYKLDFVLWFLLSSSRNKKWKVYRMTAKNSIEHISPQKPRDYEKYPVSKNMMNNFGNLVLVSRGINSEYGNKTFRTKRSEFVDKPNYDSLKSALIFENHVWNDELCNQHREKMKHYFIKYFELD
ncbi:MAG: DUF262 domain-containing HNH endonuclease family protein [Parafilimonas sp.]